MSPSAEIGHGLSAAAAAGSWAPAPPLGQRLHAAGGIDRGGPQQFGQLSGGVDVEARIGAAGQPGDLAEGALDRRVAPLLEDEDAQAEHAEFAGDGGEIVDLLLHGVADEDQHVDLLLAGLLARMGEDAADLGVAAAAVDGRSSGRAAPRASLTQRLARHSLKPR